MKQTKESLYTRQSCFYPPHILYQHVSHLRARIYCYMTFAQTPQVLVSCLYRQTSVSLIHTNTPLSSIRTRFPHSLQMLRISCIIAALVTELLHFTLMLENCFQFCKVTLRSHCCELLPSFLRRERRLGYSFFFSSAVNLKHICLLWI